MKLRRLLWTGTAAYLAYQAIKHRKTIKREALETKALADEAGAHLKDIKSQIAFIQSQIPKVTEMAKDLNYKAQIFQGEVAARTEQMPLLQKDESSK
ncbi:hypothetical protein ABID29_001353 [Streptococcus rupicaprae]|uniref:Chemotaxis protein n=1 Tax=Streptococcus rupicaprae TaxID=759619 RepID=A0ABV2FI39_9STRE